VSAGVTAVASGYWPLLSNARAPAPNDAAIRTSPAQALQKPESNFKAAATTTADQHNED